MIVKLCFGVELEVDWGIRLAITCTAGLAIMPYQLVTLGLEQEKGHYYWRVPERTSERAGRPV